MEPKYKIANCRQTTNHTFIWMFWYFLGITLVTGIALQFKGYVDEALAMIIAVSLTAAFVYIFNIKRWPFELANHNENKKKMTIPTFLILLCLMFTCQLLTYAFMWLYQLTGLPTADISSTLINNTGLAMVLYASFIGPIVEELIFRGFLIGSLKKNGKLLAVIISALCFGLMHNNPAQFFIGTFTGLLLGYVFLEYSIVWTIILHIFNNFILSELPLLLFKESATNGTVDIIILIAAIPLTIIAIIYIIKKKTISTFIKNPENRCEKTAIKQTLQSVWLWIYVGLNLALTIYMICVSNPLPS